MCLCYYYKNWTKFSVLILPWINNYLHRIKKIQWKLQNCEILTRFWETFCGVLKRVCFVLFCVFVQFFFYHFIGVFDYRLSMSVHAFMLSYIKFLSREIYLYKSLVWGTDKLLINNLVVMNWIHQFNPAISCYVIKLSLDFQFVEYSRGFYVK